MKHIGASLVIALVGLLVGGFVAGGRITTKLLQHTDTSSLEVDGSFLSTRNLPYRLSLRITNTSTTGITIDWDECALVLPNGRSERIIHTGVRFISRAEPQAVTAIPPGAHIEESVWGANMTSYVRLLGLWKTDWVRIPFGKSEFRLYLTWRDSRGTHQGIWQWQVERTLSVFWTIDFAAIAGLLLYALATME